MKKFAIVAPRFDDKIGGVICLYKLCEVLNSQGYEAYLIPFKTSFILNSDKWLIAILKFLKGELSFLVNILGFKKNSRFDVRWINWCNFKNNRKSYIVIYPEVVNGNPFGAENVVRWLLHQPGFHTGFVGFETGEFLVKFNSAINDFFINSSVTSKNYLKVIDYPFELYANKNKFIERNGVAYCIRKGKNKTMKYHPADAILIDGMSHEEVSEIFKKVKTFISYDDYTAYSLFAILAGCESVVIPNDGVTEEEWYPNIEDRFGIAYGFEKISWAQETKELQIERIRNEIKKVEDSVDIFARDCLDFFEGK